eukprot:TRINITY_DN3282_c0_g1_i2.p1 TRINITY_DN3282_c0_g1~~TRINITY_DN3282_c0_g1_i2.p1  ORF type:complete len:345 (+),score=103.97 TRINITY_DN3282_c0_g1_i2:74-1108(+)
MGNSNGGSSKMKGIGYDPKTIKIDYHQHVKFLELIRDNKLSKVKDAINKGMDKNVTDGTGHGAFYFALSTHKLDMNMIDYLFEIGCDITKTDNNGGNPFKSLCHNTTNSYKIIKEVLEKGTKANKGNSIITMHCLGAYLKSYDSDSGETRRKENFDEKEMFRTFKLLLDQMEPSKYTEEDYIDKLMMTCVDMKMPFPLKMLFFYGANPNREMKYTKRRRPAVKPLKGYALIHEKGIFEQLFEQYDNDKIFVFENFKFFPSFIQNNLFSLFLCLKKSKLNVPKPILLLILKQVFFVSEKVAFDSGANTWSGSVGSNSSTGSGSDSDYDEEKPERFVDKIRLTRCD